MKRLLSLTALALDMARLDAEPRNKEWVRVAIPESVRDKLESIEKKAGVEIRPDGDSHVIITGDKASIRKALDEMSPYFK